MIRTPIGNLAFFCAAFFAAASSHAQIGVETAYSFAAQTSFTVTNSVAAVLPNGREIHPVGSWIPLAPYPFALAVSPDGAQIAVPSIGFPFALNVIDHPISARPDVRRLPAGETNDPDVEVHAGVAYSPDGSRSTRPPATPAKSVPTAPTTGDSPAKSRSTVPLQA